MDDPKRQLAQCGFGCLFFFPRHQLFRLARHHAKRHKGCQKRDPILLPERDTVQEPPVKKARLSTPPREDRNSQVPDTPGRGWLFSDSSSDDSSGHSSFETVPDCPESPAEDVIMGVPPTGDWKLIPIDLPSTKTYDDKEIVDPRYARAWTKRLMLPKKSIV